MAYFPDLSPYEYGGEQPGVVNVGWLDGEHTFKKGTVAPHLVEKLKRLARNPVELYRGWHVCELCPESATAIPVRKGDPRFQAANRRSFHDDPSEVRFHCPIDCMSHGEIRISGEDVIYAAPMNLPHYIEAHGYQPPVEFLKALEAVPD